MPLSKNVIRCFVTSASEEYNDHNVSKIWESPLSFKKNDYLSCIYDDKWWVGKVPEVSEKNNDVHIHFFHPHGPQTSFKLSKNDTVWVPVSKVFWKLTPLELSSVTGRSYNINQTLCNEISEIFISMNS